MLDKIVMNWTELLGVCISIIVMGISGYSLIIGQKRLFNSHY